jgi:putative radical SAM enzyme (TIGR03279 family)
MEVKEHRIDGIEPGSIAEELGIEPGDFLLGINRHELHDVFDYHFLINDDRLTVQIKKADGEDWEYEIEKDYYEDLGIIFENGLMDDYRSCTNKCIFCFIDQMPPGMRDTLYFKDDDSRLSFLQGNYITMTNLSDADLDRIIRYKLAPINISVHTTNPELRVRMLHNRFAGDALKKIPLLAEAGIEMNSQIVLCKGINDGEELERTIRDLSGYIPHMQSLSVVPVGLTRFRKGLHPLEPFQKEDAKKVLDLIHKWQKICYDRYGIHFVHASDEFYLLAEEDFPSEDHYDGYGQLENGVGMIPLLEAEFMECLQEEKETQKETRKGFLSAFRKPKPQKRQCVSIATGRLAAPLMRKLSLAFMCLHPEIRIQVFEVTNHFFGEQITVSGLLTGKDIRDTLLDEELGDRLLLPCNMLRSGEQVFLDDMTVDTLSKELNVPITITASDGQSLYDALLNRTEVEYYE